MSEAVLLAPLTLAAALVTAGLAKHRSPQHTARAAENLLVPAWLSGPVLVAALPWVEIALGVGVLVLPAPWTLAAAVPALLLVVGYVVVVARVLRSGREVSCRCFGPLGEDRVGRSTLARNVLLLVAAVLTLADAAAGGSAIARLPRLGASGWLWLVGVVLVAGLAVLVTGRPTAGSRGRPVVDSGPGGPGGADRLLAEGAGGEPRAGIPFLEVAQTDGTRTSLPALASLRPQLLVALSRSCGACRPVSEVIGGWPALVPEVDVRVVSGLPAGEELPDSWPPGTLHDPDDRLLTVLGLVRPSAMLLGADALVAVEPVHGSAAVLALFEDVREALAAQRSAGQPDGSPASHSVG